MTIIESCWLTTAIFVWQCTLQFWLHGTSTAVAPGSLCLEAEQIFVFLITPIS
jgi:hypothetical protein